MSKTVFDPPHLNDTYPEENDDRKSILKFLKEHQYDYSKPIPVERVADILNDMQYDFYIEGLTNRCGDGEMTLYLDYYDSNIDAVLCILEMEYQYHLEDEEDFVDLILNLKSIVNKYRGLEFKKLGQS